MTEPEQALCPSCQIEMEPQGWIGPGRFWAICAECGFNQVVDLSAPDVVDWPESGIAAEEGEDEDEDEPVWGW